MVENALAAPAHPVPQRFVIIAPAPNLSTKHKSSNIFPSTTRGSPLFDSRLHSVFGAPISEADHDP